MVDSKKVKTLKDLAMPWCNKKMFDIAANLSDERFKGEYHGKQAHPEDFQ